MNALIEENSVKKEKIKGKSNETKEDKVCDFLDMYPKSVDEILEGMRKRGIRIELSDLFEQLINLCLENKAKQVGCSCFAKAGSYDTMNE